MLENPTEGVMDIPHLAVLFLLRGVNLPRGFEELPRNFPVVILAAHQPDRLGDDGGVLLDGAFCQTVLD